MGAAGNLKAAASIEASKERCLSVQTYMELLQCAKDKQQQRTVKRFIAELGFQVLPFTENIGHRALLYIEEYGLSSGMRAAMPILRLLQRKMAFP